MHPLDHLSEEHRSIGRVLDLLTPEIDRFRAGGPLNTVLLRRVAEFFLWPVSQCHEAKELLLYESMKLQRLPIPSAVLERVMGEHAVGREQMRDWEKAASGTLDTRELQEALVSQVMHAMRLHGEHTNEEERMVYPLARRLLPATEFEALRSGFAEIESSHETVREASAALVKTFGVTQARSA